MRSCGDVDSSGLTTSGLDLLLDQVSHLTLTIEFVLIDFVGPSTGFSLVDGSSSILEDLLLVSSLPTTKIDIDG